MTDRLSELEARVAELVESQRALERRLSALERPPAPAAAGKRSGAGGEAVAREPSLDVQAEVAALTRGLGFSGRMLLVLAGAFFLRALTDTGTIPLWLGVGLGFAYAAAWIALAHRAGPDRERTAVFHGVAAGLVGFPLVVEVTSRFHLFSPVTASATLTVFTAAVLAVATRRRLERLAWFVEAGGILAAIALMVTTDRIAPPLLFLVLLGGATLWLGYVRDWFYLRWPVALVADLAAGILALRAVGPAAAEGPATALLLMVVLIAVYLGSIATRTLLLNRGVVPFEAVQTAALMCVGLGGAAYVTVRSGHGGPILGAVSIAFGAATYAVAFVFVDRRQRARTNFYLYTSVAIAFVLAGTGLVLSGGLLSLGWAALAVAAATTARAQRRITLATHSASYGLAAAVQSGLLSHAANALFGSASVPWGPAPAASLVVLAALAAAAWLTAAAPAAPPTNRQRVPRLLLIATLAGAAAGVGSGWLVPLFAGAPGPAANLGVAATVRTAVLVAAAIALAWGGRFEGWREAGWLAYPSLAAIGMKLLLEDLPRSRPASLFLSFAAYGAALILVPRLKRRDGAARATPAPTQE